MADMPASFVLVLGGGNALGAYHAGAWQALEERGYAPGWIAGASVGALTAAVILGNPPDRRLDALREFWTLAEQLPKGDPAAGMPDPAEPRFLRTAAAVQALTTGRPGLFGPRWLWPWPSLDGPAQGLGLHDTAPLLRTLGRFIDFDRLNAGGARLTITAVDVETGEDVIFDTARMRIGPEHLRASAAFAPVYPPVEIDGRLLADAALSANLPIRPVLADRPGADTFCLAVDLVAPKGPRPRSLGDMTRRAADLLFANQARHAIRELQVLHGARGAGGDGAGRKADGSAGTARRGGRRADASVTLLHVPYTGEGEESALKMFDYSAPAIAERWACGYRDTGAALEALRGLAPAGRGGGGFRAWRYDGAGLVGYDEAGNEPGRAAR